ncbi:hypothetical protein HK100_002558, partial [Physocladia obscura]
MAAIAIILDANTLNAVYCRPSEITPTVPIPYSNLTSANDDTTFVLNVIRAATTDGGANEGWLTRIVANMRRLKQNRTIFCTDADACRRVDRLIVLSLENIAVILQWIILA